MTIFIDDLELILAEFAKQTVDVFLKAEQYDFNNRIGCSKEEFAKEFKKNIK